MGDRLAPLRCALLKRIPILSAIVVITQLRRIRYPHEPMLSQSPSFRQPGVQEASDLIEFLIVQPVLKSKQWKIRIGPHRSELRKVALQPFLPLIEEGAALRRRQVAKTRPTRCERQARDASLATAKIP